MNYCYHNRWVSQPGRLLKLTKVQQKPSPTKDNSSTGARENQIRNRVMRPSNQSYGPLFGNGTFHTFNNKIFYRKSSGGTGSNVIYWKKIAVGPRSISCATTCENVTDPQIIGACVKIKRGTCFLGSKLFLNKRRGL